ncbi:MAG: SH3 domain-containing protein [Candidatus Hydrogenedentes bacterium]|nr:SH3 domain-containing protein [Candidatus Hydrogenedentota bacterium]
MIRTMHALVIAVLVSTAAAAQTVGSTAITTGSHLRVRQGPSLNATIITEVGKGVSGEVIDAPEGIDWVKLRIPSANVEGWVHRDYLEFPGMAPRTQGQPAPGQGPAPKSVPFLFAEVSNVRGRLFVHGRFKEGLPVLLLDPRQIQVWRGKTLAQGMFENPATGIFEITDIGLEQGERMEVDPMLAIVGYPEGYTPVRPAALSNKEELKQIDALAHQSCRELVKTEVESLGARLASAATFPMGRETAYFLDYEHPYAGEYTPRAEHSYVVLLGKTCWYVYARCGSAPLLFQIDNRYFMAGLDACCECGGRAKYVTELADQGIRYTNTDWSD